MNVLVLPAVSGHGRKVLTLESSLVLPLAEKETKIQDFQITVNKRERERERERTVHIHFSVCFVIFSDKLEMTITGVTLLN